MGVQACPRCGEINATHARFCQACGAALERAGASREVRKTVSVLFVDVVASAGLAETLDPEAVRRVMGLYFEHMSSAIVQHGGRTEKFIGDAIMAVFGIPQAHEDDALRAVRAALEMRSRLKTLNDELGGAFGVTLATRTGIDTGEVVAGGAGLGQPLVTGDTVNVAARLEQICKPGEILIGSRTHSLVRDAVEVERHELELRGRSEPTVAYSLLSVAPDAAGVRRWLGAPMVGRAYELSLLSQAYARASERRTPHVFTVFGPAGVGKSRLVSEGLEGLVERATVLRGRCLPYGEGITFWPVFECVRDATGVAIGDPPEVARSKLASVLEGEDSSDLVAARVGQLIGLEQGVTSQDETFWALRKFFQALARRGPLVAVFDDLHWAEPSLLDLIEYLGAHTPGAPFLLVCLARPDLLDNRPEWGGGRVNSTSLLLEPLDGKEVSALITNILGSGITDDLHHRIGEATGGNPLFVEEIVATLAENGMLRRVDGGYTATSDLADLEIPPTIHALLLWRLDSLTEEERSVLEPAAVFGKEFYVGGLRDLGVPADPTALAAHLQSLEQKQLIGATRSLVPGDDAFRFRHILIRDAAYQTIPKERRADLHERAALWMQGAVGHAADYGEFVGYHFEAAHRYRAELEPAGARLADLSRRAADPLVEAGRRAFQRGDVRAAINLLGRAFDLLGDGEPRSLEVACDLANAMFERGDVEEADAILVDALESAAARSNALARARLEAVRLRLQLYLDPATGLEAALDQVHRLTSIFSTYGDDGGLAKSHAISAEIHWTRARAADTQAALEKTIHHARLSGDRWEEIDAVTWLVSAMLWGPTDAEEGIRRCNEIATRAGDNPKIESIALRVGACFEAMRGRFDVARELMEQGLGILRELGLVVALASSAEFIGWLELLAGDAPAAERALREGLQELERIGDRGVALNLSGTLARALCEQERFDEAEHFAMIGAESADPYDVVSQALWRSARARVLVRSGTVDEALDLASDAVGRARETDFLNLRADTLVDLAEVLSVAEGPDRTAPLLHEAADLCERKGNLVSLRRIRALAAGTSAPVSPA